MLRANYMHVSLGILGVGDQVRLTSEPGHSLTPTHCPQTKYFAYLKGVGNPQKKAINFLVVVLQVKIFGMA